MHGPLPETLPVATDASEHDRRSIFGIGFSTWDMTRLVDTVVNEPPPAGSGLRLLVTANLDHIVQLTGNDRFRQAYANAWLAVVDGTPVWIYARLRGLSVPQRLTGADLFPAILRQLRPGTHRIALLCATETTAVALRQKLEALGFDDHLVLVAPLGFEHDTDFGRRLIETLRQQRTTHLFFGIGAPKSEIWMNEHRHQLPDGYGFGFGAALDFYAGTKKRAPRVLSRIGAEFLWRVASEPRRLAKRYFVSSWVFLWAIVLDLTGRT